MCWLESYWAGNATEEDLLATGRAVEDAAWKAQADAGIELVALDGTLYDHILDFAFIFLGLVPPRFKVSLCRELMIMMMTAMIASDDS